MIGIKDGEGKLPKESMRLYFELVVTNTPLLKENTPLDSIRVNGEFSHYVTPDTDTMWLGFALGMRCAERIARHVA